MTHPHNPTQPTPNSRRSFLESVGKLGGAGALYQSMLAMGLLHAPSAWAGPAKLPAGQGAGKTVVILGAGMAGLATAYELQKAGYRCIILEALARPGGRNFTARRGTQVIEDLGPNGRTVQTCQFDDGLHVNLGAARLPFHHERVMHYCKQFAIALEVYVMSTTANLFQTDKAFGGQAMPRYRLANDVNSHIAELLNKAVNRNALDAEVTLEDRVRFIDMVRSFGGLPSEGPGTVGARTPRNNCLTPMKVEATCPAHPRLPINELLNSNFWQHRVNQPLEGEWQPTLFQPVGGMDKLVDAFTQRLGKTIRYNAEVIEVINQPDGVQVVVRDRKTGKTSTVQSDYCISNMPMPKLVNVKSNLSDEFKQAVAQVRIPPTYKLAWQAKRRFWEEPPYNMYGGISYTDNPITQMFYPSHGYLGKSGVLAGSYAFGANAIVFGNMTLAQRISAARRDAIKMLKEMASEVVVPSNKAISIAWHQAEGQCGGGALWDMSKPEERRAYQRLLAPEGRFHVMGDQVSPLSGWIEGAFMSSEHAVLQITGKRPTLVSEMQRSPDALRMMGGVG